LVAKVKSTLLALLKNESRISQRSLPCLRRASRPKNSGLNTPTNLSAILTCKGAFVGSLECDLLPSAQTETIE